MAAFFASVLAWIAERVLGSIFNRKPATPAQQVVNVEERMAKDVAGRPDDDAAIELLRQHRG